MMMLVDSNIWLALALSEHEFNPAARSWLVNRSPMESLLFCRSTQQSFLRLLTTSAVTARYGIAPLSNSEAWSTYENFLADERIAWAEEPSDIEAQWKKFAATAKASPKFMDGRISSGLRTYGRISVGEHRPSVQAIQRAQTSSAVECLTQANRQRRKTQTRASGAASARRFCTLTVGYVSRLWPTLLP